MGKKTSEQIRDEFMRYVCFKVKPNDEKHTMIEKQIDLAYGAFNRTLKYKNDEIAAKVKQEKNAEGKRADAFELTLEKDRMEAKAYCKDYLENTVARIVIGKGESYGVAEYDDQMMVWCLELIKHYKDKSEYYTLFLGQAQKWINVMIKNLFILGMIEKPYPFLHCSGQAFL